MLAITGILLSVPPNIRMFAALIIPKMTVECLQPHLLRHCHTAQPNHKLLRAKPVGNPPSPFAFLSFAHDGDCHLQACKEYPFPLKYSLLPNAPGRLARGPVPASLKLE
jgi:hypothetical protein